jgi:hypothetical protein
VAAVTLQSPANVLGNLRELYFNAPAAPQLTGRKPSVSERMQDGVANVLGKLGMGERQAQRIAKKAASFINDTTPVGAASSAEQAGNDYRGGNYLGAALNAIGAVLSAFPDGGAVAHSIIAPLYHGSPHKFEKFALEKIGTGEGHQSFGHGLYFAENPDVAKAYQRRLSAGDTGNLYEVSINANHPDFLSRDKYLGEQSPRVQQAIENIPQNTWDAIGDEMDNYGMNPIEPGDMSYKGHHLVRALERYASEGPILDAIPFDDPRQHVSEFFRLQGLPGFTYLDKGSRSAVEAQKALANPTHNYVVFDPDIIDILGRY